VEEKGFDDFEDVALGGVVGPDLPALFLVHNALEEGTEDGGGDAGPVKSACRHETVPHVLAETRRGEALGEEFTVDVGKLGEVFFEVFAPLVFGRIEDFEEV